MLFLGVKSNKFDFARLRAELFVSSRNKCVKVYNR